MENRITAIKVQKRNPNRVNIYLDGEFRIGFSRVVAAWLQIGQVLTDKMIAELEKKDNKEIVFQSALRLLNRRMRSTHELHDRLMRKGYEENVIQEVLALLQEKGYLDDAHFAKVWVEDRSTFKPRGSRLLRMELKQKGIAEPTIIQSLENLNETSLVMDAASRYVKRLNGTDWSSFRIRLTGFLARRGFSYQDINPVVRELWQQQEVSEPNPKNGRK